MNYKITASRLAAAEPPKKTVIVDLEYMRPSVSRSRSASRSRSRSVSRSRSRSRVDERLNIDELLNTQYTTTGLDGDGDGDGDGDSHDSNLSESDIESSSIDSEDDHDHDHDHDLRESRVHPSVQDTDYAVNSDDDLLQSVLDEPTFPLDVNAILNAMNKKENSTIANLTLKKIAERRREILSSLDLPTDKMEDFDRRLQMYRVIEDPQDLKHTQLLRWIPLRSLLTKPYLTLGGTLFSVKVRPDDGLHQVTIRNVKRFVFQIKFELNVVFQRLSREELLILRAVEYVDDV